MLINLYFYLFFVLMIFTAIMVLFSKNPVQSVFFLILLFLLTTVLFIIFVCSYVAKSTYFRTLQFFLSPLPVAGILGLFFLGILYFMIGTNFGMQQYNYFVTEDYFVASKYLHYNGNITYIGTVLYNFYPFFVLLASLILLVAMVGAIVLTVDFEYRSTGKTGLFKQTITRTDMKYWS